MPKSTLIQFLEKWAKKSPNSVAISHGSQTITYQELNRRSNQLAHYLIKQGVSLKNPIALFFPSGIDLIISIFGVMKAKGFYLPIFPKLPYTRIHTILQNTQVELVIANKQDKERFQKSGYNTISLEELPLENSQDVKRFHINPISPAYILMTSGSSGVPKGVVLSHENLMYYISWYCNDFLTENSLHLPLTSSMSFAAGVTQLFSSIFLGKILHIPSLDLSQPDNLLTWFKEHQDLGYYCVPTVWDALLTFIESNPNINRPVPPDGLILSGENVTEQLVQRTKAAFPSLRIWNFYGPTEGTANCSYMQLDTTKSVTIGRPCEGTALYLLNQDLNPVDSGEQGEIFISGPIVSTGYFNSPRLTALHFLPDPNGFGKRMYRTGDIGTLDQGVYSFHGRRDRQVKVCGIRVELDEIEANLLKHQEISQAVVILDLNQSIIAYILPIPGKTAPTSQAITTFLSQLLPEYMIPRRFHILTTISLLPNGKVDRKHLPELKAAASITTNDPTLWEEDVILKIWGELFPKAQLHKDAHFYELGGNSLMAAHMVARLRTNFNIELPVRAILENPILRNLAHHIKHRTQNNSLIPTFSHAKRQDLSPLSYSQEQVWFIQQIQSKSSNYSLSSCYRIRGELDQKKLIQRLNRLFEKHEILRTNFVEVDGIPWQKIAKSNTPFPLQIEVSDHRHWKERIRLEIEKPFDLSSDPLCRGLLLCLPENTFYLCFVFHHCISDQRSISLFMEELCSNEDHPCPFQYHDFINWQKQLLTDSFLNNQLIYWKKQLEGLTTLPLPFDYSRSLTTTQKGDHHLVNLPSEIIMRATNLAVATNNTLFTILLAAFQATLAFFTNHDDVIIGSPISNRRMLETEKMLGFFVNTVVLRQDLSQNPSFITLLKKCKETVLNAYHHQDLPFEKLLQHISDIRTVTRNPIFQVMFSVEYEQESCCEFDELPIENCILYPQSAKFDLSLNITLEKRSALLDFNYMTELFNPKTIKRFADYYIRFCKQAFENPTKCITDLQLLSDAETQALNNIGCNSFRDTQFQTIQDALERTVARNPNHIAFRDEIRDMTYDMYSKRSNQLAHHLISEYGSRELPIGVYLEPGFELVISLLGILKSGNVYVPFDPANPPDHLENLLNHNPVCCIITSPNLIKKLGSKAAKTPLLEIHTWDGHDLPTSSPKIKIEKSQLAYIMHTSGSQGRPKAVGISHFALINHMEWLQRTYSLSSKDIILQKTSISFDLSLWELLWNCLINVTVVFAPPSLTKSPDKLVQYIQQRNISVAHFVPSALKTILLLHKSDSLNSLRLILCCGETFFTSTYQLFKKCDLPNMFIYNLYGPTEATLAVTADQKNKLLSRTTLPIGSPINNAHIYVLDKHLNQVPINVIGELYIGGDVLARGYINQAALTAESFMPNPFRKAGARMYRTGDLVRILDSGYIEFIGRVDRQIKLRGNRIELGEIEGILNQHPHIKKAVVVMTTSSTQNAYLTAYVVQDGSNNLINIKSYLTSKLPHYMIPSEVVVLPDFPYLPSGKIDQNALENHRTKKLHAAPKYMQKVQSQYEASLLSIWKSVLNINHISLDDNFFDIGGHSLLTVQVKTLIQKQLNHVVTIVDLFQYPTIKTLGRYLEGLDSPHQEIKKKFLVRQQKRKKKLESKRKYEIL